MDFLLDLIFVPLKGESPTLVDIDLLYIESKIIDYFVERSNDIGKMISKDLDDLAKIFFHASVAGDRSFWTETLTVYEKNAIYPRLLDSVLMNSDGTVRSINLAKV